MSLERIRSVLASFKPATIKSQDLKAALETNICIDPQPTNEEALENLQEDITVDTLYNEEILSGPTTLFRVLRDYLVHIGIPYKQHPKKNLLSLGIALTFFYGEEQEYALKMAMPQKQQTVNAPSPIHTTQATEFITTEPRKEDSERKAAVSVSQQYKNNKDRFKGKLGC